MTELIGAFRAKRRGIEVRQRMKAAGLTLEELIGVAQLEYGFTTVTCMLDGSTHSEPAFWNKIAKVLEIDWSQIETLDTTTIVDSEIERLIHTRAFSEIQDHLEIDGAFAMSKPLTIGLAEALPFQLLSGHTVWFVGPVNQESRLFLVALSNRGLVIYEPE